MSANLGFVPHTTKRHAHELTAERVGDGLTERGFADTRRAHQAEDRAGQVPDASEHGDVVEDAFLHFLEAVVIGFQDRARVVEIDGVVGAHRPRQIERPVEPTARDRGVGRHRRAALELSQFAVCPRGHRWRQSTRGHLLGKIFELVAVFLAEFLVNRAQLLLQVEIALVLKERPTDLFVEFLLELEQFEFAAQDRNQLRREFRQRGCFEQALSLLKAHLQMGRDAESDALLVIERLQQANYFRR